MDFYLGRIFSERLLLAIPEVEHEYWVMKILLFVDLRDYGLRYWL